MIICHASIVFGSAEFNTTIYGWLAANAFGTVPCAPVFMILMGFFFSYPNDKPCWIKVRRGLKLFALGILLNVARGVIPYLLAEQTQPSILTGFIGLDEKIGYLASASPLWTLFYSLDILTFAGIAYVIMALMQNYVKKIWQWMTACLIIVFVAPYLWGTGESTGFFYHALLQPLWGNSYVPDLRGDNDFPAFPWLIYPITGLIMGEMMKSGSNVVALMKKLFIYGLGFVLISLPFFAYGGKAEFADYYRMYPGGSFFTLGLALLWVAMFMWCTKNGWGQAALEKLNFWSKYITLIYCVQWVLIGFCGITLGINNVNSLLAILLLTIASIAATYFASIVLLKSQKFMSCLNWFTK